MELNFLTSLHAQLGLMTWPLSFLSGVMFMLIFERAFFTLRHAKTRCAALQKEIYALSLKNEADIEHFITRNQNNSNTLAQGLCMLARHRQFTKEMREDAVNIWLQKIRRQYFSGLKLLNVIGALSPLLGLLGTVLGLIEMFKGLSQSQSISPAELADGLGLAMSTTAAGLFIALPAIAASQLFRLWGDHTLARIEYVLNHFNLYLSGMDACNNKVFCAKPCLFETQNQRKTCTENAS